MLTNQQLSRATIAEASGRKFARDRRTRSWAWRRLPLKLETKGVDTMTGSSSGWAMSVCGKSTSLPSIAKLGVMPVTLCTVILYAAMRVSTPFDSFGARLS